MYGNTPYQLNHVYNLPNEKLLFIYPPDQIYAYDSGSSVGFDTNGIMITVLNKDGNPIYSINETYIPYNATINDQGMTMNPDRYIRVKNLYNGSFSVTHQFIDPYSAGMSYNSIDGYTTLFIPTNNIYEKIVFDGFIADPLFLESSGTEGPNVRKHLVPESWPSHNSKMYTFNGALTELTKYHIDLSHLEVPVDITGTNDTADIAAINTRINQLESDIPALENSLINYADASDTALSNSIIAQISHHRLGLFY